MMRGSIYPSWRYHVDGRSVLCRTAAEDAQLTDWSDADVRWSQPVTWTQFAPTKAENTGEEAEISAIAAESSAIAVEAPKRKPGRPRKDA